MFCMLMADLCKLEEDVTSKPDSSHWEKICIVINFSMHLDYCTIQAHLEWQWALCFQVDPKCFFDFAIASMCYEKILKKKKVKFCRYAYSEVPESALTRPLHRQLSLNIQKFPRSAQSGEYSELQTRDTDSILWLHKPRSGNKNLISIRLVTVLWSMVSRII